MLQRLKEYIEFKNIKISAFEKLIGMSNASLAKPFRTGGTIGADKLELILKSCPDLNPIWLLSGVGDMLNKSDQKKLYELPEISFKVEESTSEYKSKTILLEKQIENLNKLVQEKEVRIQEKEAQLQEKDMQINSLLRLLEKQKE